MSREGIPVTPREAAENERFLQDRPRVPQQRYIKRHGILARITHDTVALCCIWLAFSGLFVFVPSLAAWAGADAVFFMRMSHRVIGVVFVAVPLIAAIAAPRGVGHMVGSMTEKWDSDDKKWMKLFVPYLFMARWIHMPDQREIKSGQRFADGMILLLGIVMGLSGVGLLVDETILPLGLTAHGVLLFVHDLGFFGLTVFGLAHIFLGAGIFQPYRGTARLMFGDGYVSESDALYHWSHWARKEIEDGKNVVEKE